MANPKLAQQSLIAAAILVLEQAMELGRRGVRAGRLAGILGLASRLFHLARLLGPVAPQPLPERLLRSHSSDRPDSITARAAEKGGGAVLPSDTS